MKKINFFNRHLIETGESYFEHFLFAFAMALWLVAVSLITIFHSIVPCVFTATTSKNIKKVSEIMHRRVEALLKRRNQLNSSNSEIK